MGYSGYGFLWSDLGSYIVGIGVGALIERLIFFSIKSDIIEI